MREKSWRELGIAALLTFGGLAGFAEGLLEMFTNLHFPFINRGPTEISLTLIGLIAMMLGLEYQRLHHKLTSHQDHVERLLASGLGGRLLHGKNAVYGAALDSVSSAKRSIHTIIWGYAPRATEWFMEGVARRLQETMKSGNPIRYEVVFVVKVSDLSDPSTFVKDVERRFDLFRRHGVENQVTLRIIDSDDRIGFDMLIVDETDVHIAYSMLPQATQVQESICFENQPRLGASLAAWYSVRVDKNAVPFEQWRKMLLRATPA
jgi:hypothetical protein